jgi:hypothetical protein
MTGAEDSSELIQDIIATAAALPHLEKAAGKKGSSGIFWCFLIGVFRCF